jgi:hypothetical protein
VVEELQTFLSRFSELSRESPQHGSMLVVLLGMLFHRFQCGSVRLSAMGD